MIIFYQNLVNYGQEVELSIEEEPIEPESLKKADILQSCFIMEVFQFTLFSLL
jgi:hypothetical protein